MRPVPPPRACQALVHRLSSTCCSCVPSARTRSAWSVMRVSSVTLAGRVARSMPRVSSISGCSVSGSRLTGWRRPKARMRCTSVRARLPAPMIWSTAVNAGLSGGRSCRSSEAWPRMAPTTLLKSCAMPLASVPIASIFCASRNCASSSRRCASACKRVLMSRIVRLTRSVPCASRYIVLLSSTGRRLPSPRTRVSSPAKWPVAARSASRACTRSSSGATSPARPACLICASVMPNDWQAAGLAE